MINAKKKKKGKEKEKKKKKKIRKYQQRIGNNTSFKTRIDGSRGKTSNRAKTGCKRGKNGASSIRIGLGLHLIDWEGISSLWLIGVCCLWQDLWPNMELSETYIKFFHTRHWENHDLVLTNVSYFGRSLAFSSRILIHFFSFPIKLWSPMAPGWLNNKENVRCILTAFARPILLKICLHSCVLKELSTGMKTCSITSKMFITWAKFSDVVFH